jgi:RNA polymerase sigma-70 factor, ECF subfamily
MVGDSAGLMAEDADTARLVARAQRGDPEAFERLYARYRVRVLAYLASVLEDPFGAEDATEEVFHRVRRGLATYVVRAGTPWRAWLFVIARNCAHDRRRRGMREHLVEPSRADVLRELVGVVGAPTGPGWIEDARLQELFDALSLVERRVLTLRILLDQTVEETARRLGRSRSSVKMLQRRALDTLAAELATAGRNRAREVARAEAFMTRRARLSPVLAGRRRALFA